MKNKIIFERTKITQVKILDNDFETINIIDSSQDLDFFCNYLNNVEKTACPQNIKWNYKIDINSKNKHRSFSP